MIRRSILERFYIWWWDWDDDPLGQLPRLIGWPVPIETDNVEVWNGGGA
ncbi:MAG: hypothetical protein IJ667_09210 [Synergistaceae bacterium]|nr:hypothetical protein [Synergistaceae bacterium]